MTVLRRCINLLSSRRTNGPFINIEEPFILLLIQIEMCGRDFFPTHLYLDHLHLIGLSYSGHSLLSGATAGLIHPIVVLLDGASKSGGMVIPKGEVEREKKKKGRSVLRRLQ